jgi:hypothetical protein
VLPLLIKDTLLYCHQYAKGWYKTHFAASFKVWYLIAPRRDDILIDYIEVNDQFTSAVLVTGRVLARVRSMGATSGNFKGKIIVT